jgi:hypothetical protein
MFVAPSGNVLISGQVGRSVLIDTATLQSRAITLAQGYGLVGADFAADGTHVAMGLLDPQQKKSGVVITDVKSGVNQSLPPGTQFLRWLDPHEILLLAPNRLIGHSIAGGEDRTFDFPTAWSGEITAGSVIPGTDIQVWGTKTGRRAVKVGTQPLQEILSGVKALGPMAVANDLSLAGGLDGEGRMWVQHGLNGTPEVIATGVERIIWGPISRRAVVQQAGNKSRVYDSRDGSWTDLGITSQAEWSDDENRLLFVESGNGNGEGYISVLIDRTIERVCDLSKIGPVAKAVLSAHGEKAFLLAGLSGGLEVWLMALPPEVKGSVGGN